MSYVVYDLETTGFLSSQCDVLQFAYIMFDENNIVVKAENLYFYKKGMHWNQEAADKSHHLSLNFLSQFEDKFESNLLKMWTTLSGSTVIGHNNIHFDDPFASAWLARQGLSLLTFERELDTMCAFRALTKRPKIKLETLGEMLGITSDMVNSMMRIWFQCDESAGAHNAMYDVTLTALIAMYGIRKGYINLNTSIINSTPEPDVFNSVLDTNPEDLSTNLRKYNAFYCHVLEDVPFYVNTSSDASKCPVVRKATLSPEESVNLFPVKFSKTSVKDIYVGTFDATTFTLDLSQKDNVGVSIDNRLVQLNTNTIPVETFLRSIQQKFR